MHIGAYLPAEFKTKIRIDALNLYFLSRNVPAVGSRYALPPTKNGKGRAA